MKIAVAGKGGVGKTTLTALLARYLAKQGRSVIAVDADPVANLGAALGIPDAHTITPIALMTELIEERTGSKKGYGRFFTLNPRVDDLPERFSRTVDGIRLMVLGGVTSGGSGCFCPESAVLRALVTHLLLRRDEVVLMDMEAGIEHLGRATAAAVSAMIVVVEAGKRSIAAAHAIHHLASQLPISPVVAVANKVPPTVDGADLEAALSPMPLIGRLPYDAQVARADLEGTAVYCGRPEQDAMIREIVDGLTRALTSVGK